MNRKLVFTSLLSLAIIVGLASGTFAQGKKGGGKKAAAPAAAPKAAAPTPAGENPDAMDLNSATPEKLMTLTGIDYMVAKKIMDARPFKKKDEIVTKKIMTQEDFNKIARSVTVKPVK